MIHPPFPASFGSRPLAPAEQAYLDAEATYDETDGGYSAITGTRPDTIAAALHDSPAGLAAWLVDKYRDWSDNHGDLENSIDRDTLLTTMSLYWASGAIGAALRGAWVNVLVTDLDTARALVEDTEARQRD